MFQICPRALPAPTPGPPLCSGGASLCPAGRTRRQTVSASPRAGRAQVTTQWSCTLASASTATAPPPSCRSLENFAPGQLHSTRLGRGPGRGGLLLCPARTGPGPAPAEFEESADPDSLSGRHGEQWVRDREGSGRGGLESGVPGPRGRRSQGSPLSPPRRHGARSRACGT